MSECTPEEQAAKESSNLDTSRVVRIKIANYIRMRGHLVGVAAVIGGLILMFVGGASSHMESGATVAIGATVIIAGFLIRVAVDTALEFLRSQWRREDIQAEMLNFLQQRDGK
ncbi:MAG TPA: hypothetical protein VGL77_06545 [Armatimonadota bacterium]|jgi:hypothetical protein